MAITSELCGARLGTHGLVAVRPNPANSHPLIGLDICSSPPMASFRHSGGITRPTERRSCKASQEPPSSAQSMSPWIPAHRIVRNWARYRHPASPCSFQLTGLAERRLECKEKIATAVVAIAYAHGTGFFPIPTSPASITRLERDDTRRAEFRDLKDRTPERTQEPPARRCAHDDRPIDPAPRTRIGNSETWGRNETGILRGISRISRRRFAPPERRCRGPELGPAGRST